MTTGSPASAQTMARLKERLTVAEEFLHGLLHERLDSIVLDTEHGGHRVYTLEASEHLYRHLVEQMSEGAALVDTDCLIVYANLRLATLLGEPLERVLGRSFLDWLDETDRALFVQRCASTDSEGHQEFTLLRMNGGEVPVLVGVSVVEGPEGTLFGLTVIDLSQQKTQHQQVHQLNAALNSRIGELSKVNRELHAAKELLTFRTLHDPLTGLPNRTLLADRLEQALLVDTREGTSTGLLFLDLDRFKEINDTFGHRFGDDVLVQVGLRLFSAVRHVDTVARLAGDEFAILLPNVGNTSEAVAVAEKIQTEIKKPLHIEGADLHLEASIGIAVSSLVDQDATRLLQHSDTAMYFAKTHDLWAYVYDPSLDESSPSSPTLFGDFGRALERGEFFLHFQPEVEISTGMVVGIEALVRWKHPERGLILPDDFIPFTEHTGLIGYLTSYVMDAAIEQARKWSDSGFPLPVSVNLSVRSLLDEGLPDQISDLVTAHGVATEMLTLEVTESAIMTEPQRSRRVLERLAALGIRISIDDFGAGYTSLSELRILPVNELKIDRSFISTMTKANNLVLIVRSIIDLGHALGLTIVAEGVENKRVLNTLTDLGCDMAQGYYLSRPIPAAAFDTWYADRRAAASQSSGDPTTPPRA